MQKTITELMHALLDFAEDKCLIEVEDREYCFNRLLEVFHMDAPEGDRPEKAASPETATPILDVLLDAAAKKREALAKEIKEKAIASSSI